MSGEKEIYQGRPGFSSPYLGPTKTDHPKPEGWEKMTLDERLTLMLETFSEDEATKDEDTES